MEDPWTQQAWLQSALHHRPKSALYLLDQINCSLEATQKHLLLEYDSKGIRKYAWCIKVMFYLWGRWQSRDTWIPTITFNHMGDCRLKLTFNERLLSITALVQQNFLCRWMLYNSALANTAATSHLRLLSTWKWQVRPGNWIFYFILVDLSLKSHMWLVATVLGSTTPLIPPHTPVTKQLKVLALMLFPDGQDLMTARITNLPIEQVGAGT